MSKKNGWILIKLISNVKVVGRFAIMGFHYVVFIKNELVKFLHIFDHQFYDKKKMYIEIENIE